MKKYIFGIVTGIAVTVTLSVLWFCYDLRQTTITNTNEIIKIENFLAAASKQQQDQPVQK